MGSIRSLEYQKERFHPGHHQQLILRTQRPLKLAKLWQATGTLNHARFTMQLSGLDVAAPGTHTLNSPSLETRPRLDLYGSALAW